MLAQTYLINTSNAVTDSVIAHFEHFHSCALLENCKDLAMIKLLSPQIEWHYHEKLFDENSNIHGFCYDWSELRRML